MAIDRRGATQKPKLNKKKDKPKKASPKKDKPKKPQPKLPTNYQPKANTPKALKPKAEKKKEVKQQYSSYKKTVAPTVTNTSDKSARENAQIGFKSYQNALAKQQKKGVVGTEKPKNISNNIGDSFKTSKKDLNKAYKIGSTTTTLGTKQKDITVELATKKERKAQYKAQKKDFYKSKDWHDTKAELKKQNRKGIRDYLAKEYGLSKDEINEWMNSDEGKKIRKEIYLENKEAVKKDINKQIKKDIKDSTTLKSVNALTRQEFGQMETASRLGKKLGNKYLDSIDKNLGKKIGSKTVEAGLRSKGAYGVMQGMSKADIWSGSVGKYDKAAKTGIQQVKDSGAYNVGYGVGMAADMLMGGVASRGVSVAEGTGKVAGKLLGKAGAKGVEKSVSKVAGKEAGKLAGQSAKELTPKVAEGVAEEYAKFTGKQGVQRFAKNRAGELVAETPTNVLDAAKMSLDADGNLDKKSFRTWLLANTGLTLGVGGAIEGIGAAATKELGKDTMSLLAKSQAGTLTEQEGKTLQKNIEKLKGKVGNNALSGNVASNISNDIDTSIKDARLQRKLEKANARSVNAPAVTETKNVSVPKAETPNAKPKISPETQQKVDNLQRNVDKVDKRIAELETKKASAKTPEMAAQIDAEISIAQTTKREIVQNQKDLINPPEAPKPKPGYKEHRIGVETRKLLRKSVKGETTEKEIRDGISEIAEDIRTNKPISEIKAKAYDLADRTMEVAKEIDHVLPEQELMEQHRAIKKLLRDTKINISQFKGSTRQILENLNISNPGRRMKLVKSGGESIERVYQHALELQAKAGASADAPEVNTLIKQTDNEEEMLQELCRLANEDKDTYKAVMTQTLSDDDIVKQIEGHVDNIMDSARKIAAAKPEPKSALEKAEEELRLAQRDYLEADGRGASAFNDLQNAKQTGEYVDEYQELYNRTQRQKFAVSNKVNELEKTVRELRKAESEKLAEKNANRPRTSIDDYADEVFGTGNKTADKKIKDVVKESEEAYDPALVKEKLNSDGTLEATTNHKKNVAFAKVREALVNNFDALEYIANRLPREARQKMLAQINELRRSIKTGRAIVAEKGRKIYADAGLTKRGKNVELKRNEFEEYCFLKHALDRKTQEKDFMDMTRSEIRDRMEELENKYAFKDKDGVIHDDKNPIIKFQQDMVQYFDELLDREVEAGITSAKEAADFRRMYPSYVPTYRAKEFDELLKRRTSDEIDVGRGLKAAKGGSDDPLVPLYNQMQVKTNTVMKRTELNKTLNLLCTACGTTEKELDSLLPFFKNMDSEEKPQALLDAQVFAHEESGGKYIATMYRNGEPIKINIDKDVYDAIRRWSGDDRKWVVLSKLVDNAALGWLNSTFKKFITDYSLIFGLKNFKRDTATALFYTTDIKGYIKNFPKAMAVCCLPDSFLSDSMRVYKEAFNTYKDNGGIISQFVARDSATPTFFDGARKFNPLKYVEDFNSILETIPRMSEFISAIDGKAVKIAGKEGDYDKAFRDLLANREEVANAMYRAKDVTLNFDRSGWFGARLNRGLVPFFNPAIQGLDKLGRKMIRDNIKYGADGNLVWIKAGGGSFFKDTTVGSFMKFGAALGGMVGLPAIVWNEMPVFAEDGNKYKIEDYINGKVPGYQKQSDYNRYANYLFPVGDGKFIKIPRARELASMQSVVDFAMDNMKYGSGSKWDKLFGMANVRDFKSMLKISYEQIGPVTPVSDSLFTPLLNNFLNKTWYGGKIESGTDLDYREAGERYKIWDENTSAVAKLIGKQFNLSPKKVDNILDSYTGIIYDYGLIETSAKNDIIGRFKEEGLGSGIGTMLSSPFSHGFVVDSVFSNANKTDYYNYVDARDKQLEKLKEGSPEYLKLFAEKNKDKNAFGYTSSQYDELVSQVYLDKNLTPSEKNYYARMLKKGDSSVWNDRQAGRVTVSRDPMAVAWNMKDGKGKRVLSTKTIINSCSYTFKNGGNTIKDAYTSYKKNGGKSDAKFMEVTLSARDVNRSAGESLSTPRWEIVAYANQLNHIKNSDKVMASYIEKDTKRKHLMENARIYEEFGFTLKNYKTTRKTVVQGAFDLGYEYAADMRDGELTMVLANARTKNGKKYRDGSYQANDFWIMQRMNSARCLDHKRNGNIQAKQIKELCDKYKLNPNDDYSWDVDKVANAVSKEHGDLPRELQAAMVQVITGCRDYKNPFGSIGDYSLDSDTGIYCEGHKGYGHRRHGGWGWHGGGGRKTPFTPKVNTAGKGAKVTDTSKKNTSKKSNLDDAYRKKLKKLREETRKN